MGIQRSLWIVATGFALIGGIAAAALAWSAGGVALTGQALMQVLLLLLGLLVAAIVAAYWMGRPLRRRLLEIEEAAALIASGRLQYRVPTWGETDEVGRLADGFNRMGDQIEQQVSLLQALAEDNRRLAGEAERAAVMEERQRLARELHDSVSQQLFAVTMLAATAQRQHDTQQPILTETLRQLSSLANTAQREMRALLLHLGPVELEGRSLTDAAQAFLSSVTERHGLQVELRDELESALGDAVEAHLFRILQEAVANILKHAHAGHCAVHLWEDAQSIYLAVSDDGVGIDEGQAGQSSGDAYGLQAMRERAAMLGGRCDIWRRDQGTTVQVQVPRLSVRGGGS